MTQKELETSIASIERMLEARGIPTTEVEWIVLAHCRKEWANGNYVQARRDLHYLLNYLMRRRTNAIH